MIYVKELKITISILRYRPAVQKMLEPARLLCRVKVAWLLVWHFRVGHSRYDQIIILLTSPTMIDFFDSVISTNQSAV